MADLDDRSDPRQLDPWGHLDPWDRQPGEGPTAYRRFLMYRDLGRARSLREVAEREKASRMTVNRMAWEQRWAERAAAWDREQEKELQSRLAEARVTQIDQHLKITGAMLAKAVDRLRTLDPEKMSVAELRNYIDTAVRLQRLVIGESTSNTAISGAILHDVDRLNDEEKAQRMADLAAELERRRAAT